MSTGAKSCADDIGAALRGEDRDRARSRGGVEHALTRLRVRPLDHEGVDVSNRVRDPLVRPVAPSDTLPGLEFCECHVSSFVERLLRIRRRGVASLPRMSRRSRRPRSRRAPHRLGLDGRDGATARARARGAVSGPAVRGDPAPARRERRRPPHRRAAGAGRPAVMVYTLVEPGLRGRDAPALPSRARPLLRPARASDRLDLARGGRRRADGARSTCAARLDVLQADRGDRVRGQVRRRRRERARRGGHRPRRRLAHVEDAALDLSSATSATRRRTCPSSVGSTCRRSSSRSTRRRSSGSRSTPSGSRTSAARA